MRMRAVVMALALAAVAAVPVAAQEDSPLRPVRLLGGIHLVGALPTGEFADHIDGGIGVGVDVVWPVKAESWLGLRADAGWVVYGSETKEICLISCRVRADLSTTNSIFYLGAGPQLMAPRGPVRPYVNVSGGFAYFSTTSSLEGNNNNQPFATDTNADDITLAWSAGGGLLVPLSRGRTPVSLNLGAQYHGNGNVEYLKEGDITDNPDGTIEINPTRSDANFVTIRLGVSIGVRPGMK